MIDWRGTPIKVGSHIVYPGRFSSSMWVIEAVVLEITEIDDPYHYGNRIPAIVTKPIRQSGQWDTIDPDRKSIIYRLDRVTVIS